MKKIVSLFLVVICFFAFMLNLSGNDPDNEWSFQSYCEYVTENIKPLPTLTVSFSYDESASGWAIFKSFISWLGGLLAYPFELLPVLVHNIYVLVDGFFPVQWVGGSYPGQTGSSGESGSFGGGGFGGGAGGAR